MFREKTISLINLKEQDLEKKFIYWLTFGTLYPAYRSYKAIKNKDVREYVKWMMYWVIFALFTAVETFADVLLSWLPLYYEIKIVFFIWLLSPATKGSSILYRKFVHPRLVKHEKAIDKYISQAQRNSYAMLMDAGRRGFSVAADTFVKTAVSGQYQLVETLKRYNSMQELRNTNDETDAVMNAGNMAARRGTWYDGMPPGYGSDGSNYDPENDVRFLQSQYKQSPTGEVISEEGNIEVNDLQRSQSDNSLLKPPTRDNENIVDDGLTIPQPKQTSSKSKEDFSDGIDYSYQYSSNTLPRARRAKKPIHEDHSRWSVAGDQYDFSSYSANRRVSDRNPYQLRSHISPRSKYIS